MAGSVAFMTGGAGGDAMERVESLGLPLLMKPVDRTALRQLLESRLRPPLVGQAREQANHREDPIRQSQVPERC